MSSQIRLYWVPMLDASILDLIIRMENKHIRFAITHGWSWWPVPGEMDLNQWNGFKAEVEAGFGLSVGREDIRGLLSCMSHGTYGL